VVAVFQNLHAFNATITDLKDPFGNSVTNGTVSVTLDPACVFDGDTETEAGFFGLFNSLSQGETLEVEVFGVGTVTLPNDIQAYEVKVRVN
jgi:hypothetical protein